MRSVSRAVKSEAGHIASRRNFPGEEAAAAGNLSHGFAGCGVERIRIGSEIRGPAAPRDVLRGNPLLERIAGNVENSAESALVGGVDPLEAADDIFVRGEQFGGLPV